MTKPLFRNHIIFVLFVCFAFGVRSTAQTASSLFLLEDNFHSQMMNPSYMGENDAITIAIPGLAGGSFGNYSNFKFTSLIRKQPDETVALDLEHFYNQGIAVTKLSDWSTIPIFFFGMPLKNGRLSVYLKEQLYTSGMMETEAIDFFNVGNAPDLYRSYNMNNAQFNASLYREIAVGYATNYSDKLSFGLRAKILFGIVLLDINDWQIGIETSERGDEVLLTSKGTGRLSVPFEVEFENNKIRGMSAGNVAGGYLGAFENPGLAIDLGVNYLIDEQSRFTFSATDLGGIWFRKDSYEIDQDSYYAFRGFELSNTLDSQDQTTNSNFVDSYRLMYTTKDSIREVFYPEADTASFFRAVPPKLAAHYQYDMNEVISFGVTNYTVFLKKNILNTFSVSSKQTFGGVSFFQNINLNKINSVSLGGGVQLTGKVMQFYILTDNFLAVYHPANQKNFTVSAGFSFFFNAPEKEDSGKKKNGFKKGKGFVLPHLPFFERKKK